MNSLLMGALIIAVVVGLVMYMPIDGFQAAGSAAPARQRGSVAKRGSGGGGAKRGNGAKKVAGSKPAMTATPAMGSM